MLEQHARVVSSVGAEVRVEAIEPEACGVCAGEGCASRRLAELFQRRPRQFPVACHLSLAPGDKVIVGIRDGSVLRSAVYMYGLPLMGLIGGALLLQVWFPGDAGAIVGAVAGLAAAAMYLAFTKQTGSLSQQPVVIRRLVEVAVVEELK